jgi:ferredoxin
VKLSIDSDVCNGHTFCASVAPSLVELDGAGRPLLVTGNDITDDRLVEAEAAVRNCPERAITLTD